MEREMKQLGILGVLLVMTACAPMKSLEELEAEALRSGDWSLVEEREALIAKRNSRRPMQCPGGTVSLCERSLGQYSCQCVAKGAMAGALVSR